MATSELEGKDIWGDDADDIDDEIMSVSLVAQRAAFRNSRMVPADTGVRHCGADDHG